MIIAPSGDDRSGDNSSSWLDYGPIFSLIYDSVGDPLKRTAKDTAEYGTAEIGQAVTIEPGFYDEYAADYARDCGAEMIGMKWVDG